MTLRLPRLAVAILAGAAVALTGCVRVSADTEISTEETFSQHSVIAVSAAAERQLAQLPQLAEASRLPEGLDLDALLEGAAQSPALEDLTDRYPGQVEVADYDDGELRGIEITVTDLPLDEFDALGAQATGGLGAQASIATQDDQFVVTMTPPADLDLGAAGVTASSLSLIESSVEVAVTFSFPGLVREASAGDVSGTSVTLGLADLLSGEEIVIVADAGTAIDWGPWLRWGGIVLAFALVIGGAAALVLQDRRKQRETVLPPPQVSDAPAGPGMIGGSGAPPPERD